MPVVLRLRVSATVRAPPELVFRAWTEPSLLRQWMRLGARGRNRLVMIDPRVGDKYRFEFSSRGRAYVEAGNYHTVRPPEQLVYTCRFGSPGFIPPYEFTTRVDFGSVAAGTRLVLLAHGFADSAQRDEQRAAWPSFLERLRGLCEGKGGTPT